MLLTSQVAIEELEISHEGFRMQSPGTREVVDAIKGFSGRRRAMDVEIGEMENVIHVTDTQALLDPKILERIVVRGDEPR